MGIKNYMEQKGYSNIGEMVGKCKRDPNSHHICTIEKIIDETPTVRTLIFSDEVLSNVLPGQFAMVWIPGVNELPMSVMITQEKDKAAFTVRNVVNHQLECIIFLLVIILVYVVHTETGFDIKDGNLLLIGGGTGLVPLLRLITSVSLHMKSHY